VWTPLEVACWAISLGGRGESGSGVTSLYREGGNRSLWVYGLRSIIGRCESSTTTSAELSVTACKLKRVILQLFSGVKLMRTSTGSSVANARVGIGVKPDEEGWPSCGVGSLAGHQETSICT
jgi:hypothetical protein